MRATEPKKQDNSKRTRKILLGLRITEQEQKEFNKVCKKLGVTKTNFLIESIQKGLKEIEESNKTTTIKRYEGNFKAVKRAKKTHKE